jgi:hypothetical protein
MLIISGMALLVGQGDDGHAMRFAERGTSFKSGLYISKKDQINFMGELINYDNYTKDIYTTLEYEYIPNMPARPKDYYDVGMYAINVTPCGGQGLCKCFIFETTDSS